jgi:DNA repair protein RadD
MLRTYQIEAVNHLFRYFENHSGNPLVAMPTGTGKSHVIAAFLKRIFHSWPHSRVFLVSHVQEILMQDREKLEACWPESRDLTTVYSASLKEKDTTGRIVLASIASLVRAPEVGHVDLMLVDECHLVSPRGATMYNRVVHRLAEMNPAVKVVGFTATPFRMSSGLLTSDNGLFTDVCFDLTTPRGFQYLLTNEFLAPLITTGARSEATLNLEGVGIQGGEFVARDLQRAADIPELLDAVVAEIKRHIEGHAPPYRVREHLLVFTCGIDHAEHLNERLQQAGIRSGVVHSKCPPEVRSSRIAAFKAGDLQALCNYGILTTGFDYPAIDAIAVVRATRSPGLWVQMLGRGTRPTDGKTDCLVLDFGGNTARLGPIDQPVVRGRSRRGPGAAPVHACPECGTYLPIHVFTCPACDHTWTPRTAPEILERTASDLPVMSEPPRMEWWTVNDVRYRRHKKRGKPDSLKVEYYCGLSIFREWICLEHQGYARMKAEQWWAARENTSVPPSSVTEALRRVNRLSTPTSIRVWTNKPYPEIMEHSFT